VLRAAAAEWRVVLVAVRASEPPGARVCVRYDRTGQWVRPIGSEWTRSVLLRQIVGRLRLLYELTPECSGDDRWGRTPIATGILGWPVRFPYLTGDHGNQRQYSAFGTIETLRGI
jgi:hypothetical protein